jgi:hypothetical protein
MSGEAGIAKYASVQILHNSKFIIRHSIFALISLPPSWELPDTTALRWSIHYIDKPLALPGDSKSLIAPYFETLRNAEKALTYADLFGEGRLLPA